MRYFLFLLLTAILVACTAEVSQETPSPVAIIIETLPPAGDTPTATATRPATDTPTTTATRPATDNLTETATPLPTLPPTPPPAPAGRILFFWDSETYAAYIDPWFPEPTADPKQDLYLAIPGPLPDSPWHITPLLHDLLDREQFAPSWPHSALSPDQTKIAFNVATILSDGRSGDSRAFYSYDLVSHQLLQLTPYHSSQYALSWFLDNQTLTYGLNETVYSISVNDLQLQSLVTPSNEYVAGLSWSPDGQTLAINLGGSPTSYNYEMWFLTPVINQLVMRLDDGPSRPRKMEWSTNGQWLATNYGGGGGVILFQSSSFLPEVLVESDVSVFDWAKDDSILVYSQTSDTESSLFTWNAETLSTTQLVQYPPAQFSSPIWANHSSDIAIRVQENKNWELLVINAETKESKSLLSFENVELVLEPLAWSPDDQWLLFLMSQADEQGLYVINISNGAFYQILDTMHRSFPTEIYWLSGEAITP